MNIDELRKIAGEATQGGWIADGGRFNHYLGRGIGQVWGVNWRNDLRFITTFHPLQVLALLDHVEKAQQELGKYDRLLERTENEYNRLETSHSIQEKALQRVRELHQVDEYTAGHTIVRCVCEEMWPCSTIRALGETNERY